MSREQPPAFLFWAKRWRLSESVRLMTHEEKGVFIDLLSEAWENCGIPDDPRKLARLLGLTPKKFARVWETVGQQWESNGEGRLVNPVLEQVRADYWAAEDKRSKAGRAAAEARWKKAPK